MALFRLPLFFDKKITFRKLLGCGKNGAFDIHPDWRQWGILVVLKDQHLDLIKLPDYATLYGGFIHRWWKLFNCEKYSMVLQPLEGHGTWDGKHIFGQLPAESNYEGMIVVLTRATIRTNRLKNFWRHVDGVADAVRQAPGFISSIGIGEMPWKKQATLSFWESKEKMKQFAYGTEHHKKVMHKTRQEKWYSEDMFVRFKLLQSYGTLQGINPLEAQAEASYLNPIVPLQMPVK